MRKLNTGLPGASGEDGYAQFEVSTTQTIACTIAGYPSVVLDDSSGEPIGFTYQHDRGSYVTSRPPAQVPLSRGSLAYFIVTKYRCDVRHTISAAKMQIHLPGYSRAWTFTLPGQPGGFDYCLGNGSPDPGDTVTVSPMEATFSATLP